MTFIYTCLSGNYKYVKSKYWNKLNATWVNRFCNTLCHKAPDEGRQAFARGDVVKTQPLSNPLQEGIRFVHRLCPAFPDASRLRFYPEMGESAGLTQPVPMLIGIPCK